MWQKSRNDNDQSSHKIKMQGAVSVIILFNDPDFIRYLSRVIENATPAVIKRHYIGFQF